MSLDTWFPSAQLCIILYSRYINIMCIFTVNIALNKPAYMQYQYRPGDNKFDASNAVDRRKSDLRLSGGQCTTSDPHKQTATWWVNLTSIQSIHHITIFYMTGNGIWGTIFSYFWPLIQVTKSYTKCILTAVYCRSMTNRLNSHMWSIHVQPYKQFDHYGFSY